MDIVNLLGQYAIYAGDITFILSTFIVVIVTIFHDSFKDPAIALRYSTLIGLVISILVFFSVGVDLPAKGIFNNSYINDAFALGGKFIILVCGICACVFNKVDDNIKLSNYMFYPLSKISTAGGFIALSSTSLSMLSMAIGIILVSTSVMVVLSSSDKIYSKTNSVFLIAQCIGFVIFMLGVVYIYSAVGTVQYDEIKSVLSHNIGLQKGLVLGLILIISAIGVIIGAVPFSNWVAKLHTSMFDCVAVYLRTAVVVVFVLVLSRLLYGPFSSSALLWKDIVLLIGICGVLVGTMGMIMQQNIDQLYGYGSIGHIGFLFLALSIGNVNSISAIFIYTVSYVVSYVAFLGYGRGIIANGVLVTKLDDLSGCGRSMALHALSFAVAGLAYAGLPPFIGFLGKISVLGVVLQWDLPIIVSALVIAGILQSIWVLRLFRVMYFTKHKIVSGGQRDSEVVFINKAQKGMAIVRRFAIIISILFLFVSGPVITLSQKMSSVF